MGKFLLLALIILIIVLICRTNKTGNANEENPNVQERIKQCMSNCKDDDCKFGCCGLNNNTREFVRCLRDLN